MKCAVENIDSITATSLRKYFTTIAQIISMTTYFYRKTDYNLQIAKISKLLLLMEKKLWASTVEKVWKKLILKYLTLAKTLQRKLILLRLIRQQFQVNRSQEHESCGKILFNYRMKTSTLKIPHQKILKLNQISNLKRYINMYC